GAKKGRSSFQTSEMSCVPFIFPFIFFFFISFIFPKSQGFPSRGEGGRGSIQAKGKEGYMVFGFQPFTQRNRRSAETKRRPLHRLRFEQLESRVVLNAPSTGWQLSFVDEFSGSAIDQSKWTTKLAWSGSENGHYHNTNYLSYIVDDDVIVSNGTLKLRTEKRDVIGYSGKVYHYTEGFIQTRDHYFNKYGYFEIRAQLPVSAGKGPWPAFWLLSDGWPPEIDTGEWWTANNHTHQGLAYKNAGGGVSWDDKHTYTPLPTGWHTYGLQWSPDQLIFSIDGQTTKTINASYVPNVPMYIILNSGVEAANPPNSYTVFPNDFAVDYVRVYQQAGAGATLKNPDFEQGTASWSLSGSAQVVNFNQRTGDRALRMNGSTGTAQQVITGLTPNTTYTLGGWDRVSYPATEARIGVNDYCG